MVGPDVTLTDRFDDVVRDPQIDIVVELIGGREPARRLVLAAIQHDKHVVTANKALLAVDGNEVFAAARAMGVMVVFEAAVAGGIPIIKAVREGLSANRIEWIAGIINGTSNYILSEMRAQGLSFAAALRRAQELGYAETDPSFDVDGIDAGHKLAILSAIAFGVPIRFDAAHIEGIARLAAEDIRNAERVHPTLVPLQRLLANVEGAMNAVLVKGDAVGTTMYYGPGAGSEPTASAVVADLVDVTRMHTADPEDRVPHLAFQPDAMMNLPWLSIEDTVTAYYFRMPVIDRPGVLADITRILADLRISIDALFQRAPAAGENQTDIIMRECGDPAHRGVAVGGRANHPHSPGKARLMRYFSTRGNAAPQRFCAVLLEGLAPDGGLMVPEYYPQVDGATLERWRGLDYAALALEVLARFCDDIPRADLERMARAAYSRENFGTDEITPLVPLTQLDDGLQLLALSNGPTLAFKDLAMQLLGRLFEYELERRGARLNVLGATSGDTGSAAEYALRGRAGISVFMLSPQGRMSAFQRAQMYSLADANIFNIAVAGVFDDCQDLVKAVAADLDFKRRHAIGSVNSINWARIMAQVVYYFRGYFAATAAPATAATEPLRVSFCVDRAQDGTADRPPGARHQREQRARRVLPHRPLSRAQCGGHVGHQQPLDGHLQGLELRALHLRPGRA